MSRASGANELGSQVYQSTAVVVVVSMVLRDLSIFSHLCHVYHECGKHLRRLLKINDPLIKAAISRPIWRG